MQLNLVTWNGIAINDGTNYQAWIPPGQLVNLSANAVTVPRANAYPFLSTTVLTSHVFVIHIKIMEGKSIPTYRELIKTYFNIQDTNRHNLVAYDILDSNRPWYLTGIPVRVVELKAGLYSITLQIESPIWKLVTAGTNTWNITASGQTNVVSNIGNINAKPSFAITPTTTKTGGLTYRRWIPIYSNLDVGYADAFDLTAGLGFDTASLTTAKMQADGQDLRIWMDGVEIECWLYNTDSAATQIWINLVLSPRKQGTTSVTIAASGAVSTISFSKTKANLAFLQAMATAINKVVLIDSEAFTFTGVNLVTYQLTGVTRAQKDTGMAVHTAPLTCRWIEHDVWMLYGDPTLDYQELNPENAPIFELNSSNSLHIYGTYFFNENFRSPGSWNKGVKSSKTGLSYIYTGYRDIFADPAYELGLAMVGSPSEFNAQIETAQIEWSLFHPAGITQVTFYGEKYMTGSWPAIAGLQYLQEDATWVTIAHEAAPTIPLTWQLFGQIIGSLGGTRSKIRLVMDGSLSPVAGEKAMIQFDTVNVTLSNSNVPIVTIGAETPINFFDFTLSNNTTGEYIKVAVPCLVTTGIVTVDCENKKAYLQDGSRANVILSTNREAWLDLLPGNNTLQFDDAGTVAVTLITTHRDGNL